jgi:CCR4-NOT transcriptional regulation complex NOT5 subunit
MPSDLQITNIRDQANANSAITIGSDGQITVNQNNPTLTLGNNVSMASSGVTVRNITQVALFQNQLHSSSVDENTVFSPTYTPLFSGSKVRGLLHLMASFEAVAQNARKILKLEFTGSGITDITMNNDGNQNVGNYDFGSSGVVGQSCYLVGSPLLTTSSTATITCNVKMQNQQNASSSYHLTYGNNTMEETHMTWIEYK